MPYANGLPWAKPKNPDIIPTNEKTGVPDKYYSLGTPGGTPDWAKVQPPPPKQPYFAQSYTERGDGMMHLTNNPNPPPASPAKPKQMAGPDPWLEKIRAPNTTVADEAAAEKKRVAEAQASSQRTFNALKIPMGSGSQLADKPIASDVDTPGVNDVDRAEATQQGTTDSSNVKPLATQSFGRSSVSSAPGPSAQTLARTAANVYAPVHKRGFLHEAEVKKYVEDISTPATCLLFLCMDEWGTDLTTWEPDTLPYAAQTAWNANIPQANRDKIWALVTHLTTDSFYSNLEAFIHICGALSGRGVDFEQFDPVEVDELCWGITEAFLISPMEKDEQFNEEILAYIEQRLEYEGFQKVPHMLRKFVKIPAREEAIDQTLTSDGIGFENYWKMQESRLANLDIWLKERLAALFMTLENLPLRYANEQGLQRICARVRSALGSQSSLKREVEAASR